MEIATNSINFDSTPFKVFYVCSALLVLKMLLMSLLVARQRVLKKVVANQEDTKIGRGMKVKYNDQDVERVRRAHLNDLENILMFLSVGSLFAALGQSALIAVPLFIAFTLARFTHTFVYAIAVKDQPARAISFAVGFVITAYMAAYLAFKLRDAM